MTPADLDALRAVMDNKRSAAAALRKALKSALEEIERARLAADLFGGCKTCYSHSWTPAAKGDPGAMRDPQSPGRFRICGYCDMTAKAKSDA